MAWAAAIWPWSDEVRDVIMFRRPGSTEPPIQVADRSQDSAGYYKWVFSHEFTRGEAWPEFHGGLHSQFIALVLTLAAFFTLKYAWTIAQCDLMRRKRLYLATVVVITATFFVLGLVFGEGPDKPATALLEALIIAAGAFLFGLLVILISEIFRRFRTIVGRRP